LKEEFEGDEIFWLNFVRGEGAVSQACNRRERLGFEGRKLMMISISNTLVNNTALNCKGLRSLWVKICSIKGRCCGGALPIRQTLRGSTVM
jgi:hypothetical protein